MLEKTIYSLLFLTFFIYGNVYSFDNFPKIDQKELHDFIEKEVVEKQLGQEYQDQKSWWYRVLNGKKVPVSHTVSLKYETETESNNNNTIVTNKLSNMFLIPIEHYFLYNTRKTTWSLYVDKRQLWVKNNAKSSHKDSIIATFDNTLPSSGNSPLLTKKTTTKNDMALNKLLDWIKRGKYSETYTNSIKNISITAVEASTKKISSVQKKKFDGIEYSFTTDYAQRTVTPLRYNMREEVKENHSLDISSLYKKTYFDRYITAGIFAAVGFAVAFFGFKKATSQKI